MSSILADTVPLYALVDPDDQYHSRAQNTLFDAVVAVASDQLEAPVWTFDHHFDVMRSRVWR